MPESSSRTWPSVTYEERPWQATDHHLMSRRRRRSHSGPYLAAVVPEIAEAQIALPSEVLADADEATAEIARFDAELGDRLSRYTPLLLRSESAASSQIENLTASARAIALAELGDRSRPNAALVVANSQAMQAAIDLSERLDQQAILDMQEILLRDEHPEWVGRWRDQQVWIGGTSWGPHEAMFIPPHHERVPAGIDDLVAFMARDDIPALIHAALAHAQFETIHPFPDGNGRTGRSLVHALLRSREIVRHVTLPVSAGLLADVDAYFAALTSYREGNPEPIVGQFVDASYRAIDNSRRLVGELEQTSRGWSDKITARREASVWRLTDLLLRQPVIDGALVRQELGITAPAANQSINHLVEPGILTQIGTSRRNRRWSANEVLQALDDFAARAGRRAAPPA
jgi:Fic family protein